MYDMPPSSRGLGHLPFTEVTGIRIPLGVLLKLHNFKISYLFKLSTLSFRINFYSSVN